MNKNYLIVWNISFAARKTVTNVLSSDPDVVYWYACFSNCVFCTASVDAHLIAKRLEKKIGTRRNDRFLVIEVTNNMQGRLPAKAWHMLNNPDNPKSQS